MSGRKSYCRVLLLVLALVVLSDSVRGQSLHIGVAVEDITPPIGFPMAGYYHERLAEGTIDPLLAKAMVFRDGTTSAAFVVCDLIAVARDLSKTVRERIETATGIPASNIAISATHSHTAPDYTRELYLFLAKENQIPLRKAYVEKLLDGITNAVKQAATSAAPANLSAGSAPILTPVSFNRRAVMRDGTVRTWVPHSHPDFVRAAGPIDPAIEILVIRNGQEAPRAVFSNFALHLDTVGGQQWSADYPYHVQQALRSLTKSEVISIFGTGTCGDINHINPAAGERNKTEMIGQSIAASIAPLIDRVPAVEKPNLKVKSVPVLLPLQTVTKEEVALSVATLQAAARKEKIDFFDHVTAYKRVIIDQIRNPKPFAHAPDILSWGLSHTLAGAGDSLPVEISAITLGHDVAIVFLPGEVFVELGLAIKHASPFRTTFVVELSNSVETIYIPTRPAHAAATYEATNSTTKPGSGEILVEAALRLLKDLSQE